MKIRRKIVKEYREKNIKLCEDIADLEIDIKEKEDFTNKLRKQRNSLENEVKHLNTNIEKKNEDILHMEFYLSKQKEISKFMIKAIGFEKGDLKEKLDAANIIIGTLKKDMKNKVIKEITMEKEMIAEMKSLENPCHLQKQIH